VVFDMNWLNVSSSDLSSAVEYLSYWLNSVVINARSNCGIYSTHRYEVADAAEYIRNSGLLDATFSGSLAWPSVVE
jgi:hypothetical protein